MTSRTSVHSVPSTQTPLTHRHCAGFRTLALGLLAAAGLVPAQTDTTLLVDQTGYELLGPKRALLQSDLAGPCTSFEIVPAAGGSAVFQGPCAPAVRVEAWGRSYQVLAFDTLSSTGRFRVRVGTRTSVPFEIDSNLLWRRTFHAAGPAFFRGMRHVRSGDEAIPFFGEREGTVDVRGGWVDATGDAGKHLSHLSYANFMNPQQIPLVAWGLLHTEEMLRTRLDSSDTALVSEAVWGLEFLSRMLDAQGYFYQSVFDVWGGGTRYICGWSTSAGVQNANYESAWREGGGMSIAALARGSRLQVGTAQQNAAWLEGARRAFTHLASQPGRYADDGLENILDHTTALIAAIELARATDEDSYLVAARNRVDSLLVLQHDDGWFQSRRGIDRPFWHAADEGLPWIALIEAAAILPDRREAITSAASRGLGHYRTIGNRVENPFRMPRQVRSAVGSGATGPRTGNLARGATATASTVQNSGQEASRAIDADPTSRWSSALQDSTGWIAIDLGQNFLVRSVAVTWEAAHARTYAIETSTNGTDWIEAVRAGATGAGRVNTILEPAVLARHVRIRGIVRSSPHFSYSIHDIEILGTEPDRPPEPARPPVEAWFMPHENETGYWWQGENARLSSLSAAFLAMNRLVDPRWVPGRDGRTEEILAPLHWIGGRNPLALAMMHGFGAADRAYPGYFNTAGAPLQRGGICNGITSDGTDAPQFNPPGLPYVWSNWRWVEQWLPHNAWWMIAVGDLGTTWASIDSIIVGVGSPAPRMIARAAVKALSGGRLRVIGVQEGAVLELLDLTGRRMARIRPDAQGFATAPLGVRGTLHVRVVPSSGKAVSAGLVILP